MSTFLRRFTLLMLIMLSFAVQSGEQPDFNEIKSLAEKGDAKAQAKYGAINFLGGKYQLNSKMFKTRKKFEAISYLLDGVTKNDEMATQWMMKSAEQGYPDAEVFMAAMYDRGMGVSQNKSKATGLYKKAAEHGNETAEAILGRYAQSRLTASKDIPEEYAIKILNTE